MRLFAKIFICVTLIISVALLLSGYLLIIYSSESAALHERDRGVEQFQYDKFNIQASLHASAGGVSYPGGAAAAAPAPDALAAMSRDVNGLTAFFDDEGRQLYSGLPSWVDVSILGHITSGEYPYQIQTHEDECYLLVGGLLDQGGERLYLLIATDISHILTQRQQMTQNFFWVYSLTFALSLIAILALSALITRPLKKLSSAAVEIAQGQYSLRLPVLGGDEIDELAGSFNRMAAAVEEKIQEITVEAERKEDFVANFAHELKTPMTSVIGYADMLYQKTLSPKQVKDAAWYILSEGMRLESLSLKLLELIVLKRQVFTLEETRSDTLMTSITDGIGPLLRDKGVSLTLAVQPAYVMIEHDLFKTLLLNLIDNATKAGCDNIKIVGAARGKRYAISVTDNGRGIPDGEMERIGEAFYMVDKSRSRKQHGAGLGLSLAGRIAEIHGTALSFESAEGFGTIVTFELELIKKKM